LVQGLTEFLPVSSSGHLVLVEALTGVRFQDVSVEVSLHVATLGSVLVLYGRRLWQIARGVLRRDPGSVRYAGLLILATIPAGLIGVLFHRLIEAREAVLNLSAIGLLPWAVSFIFAFVAGLWSIRFLIAVLRRGRFHVFAPYCWAVGVFTIGYAMWRP